MVKGSKRDSIASMKSGVRVTREDTACTLAGEGRSGGSFKATNLIGTVWQTCRKAGLYR